MRVSLSPAREARGTKKPTQNLLPLSTCRARRYVTTTQSAADAARGYGQEIGPLVRRLAELNELIVAHRAHDGVTSDEVSLSSAAAVRSSGGLLCSRDLAARMWRGVVAGVTDADDPQRFAYLAKGNARQARKRVAADVLITDQADRILLVDPVYKPDWDMPGGMAEANEPPRAAAERELREELGLNLTVGRLLVLEWQPPHGPWDDLLTFVFDGGVLDEETVGALKIRDDELRAFDFVPVADAHTLLRPYVWERLDQSVQAKADREKIYVEKAAKH